MQALSKTHADDSSLSTITNIVAHYAVDIIAVIAHSVVGASATVYNYYYYYYYYYYYQ